MKDEMNKVSEQKKEILIAGFLGIALLLSIVFIITYTVNSDINFSEKYSYYLGEDWFEVADDNSYMKIDTNPHDLKNKTEYSAMFRINSINKELGFSESLYKKMEDTKALDGRQTEENRKIRVSWTYHPDEGLEVMYENK